MPVSPRSWSLLALVACAASAKPVMLEIKSIPASPRAALAMISKEKPGPFRRQLITALEARLREKGSVLNEPESVDALAALMFGKVFDEMAAPTEVWSWSGDEGLPRGDVLIRKTVKLMPGATSKNFSKSYTVSPKGKRIDRGFLNTPCTLEVSVAKSDTDWYSEVEEKGGWVASLAPVQVSENVARVALQLLSPGKSGAVAPRHERPVWVAFFTRENDHADWSLALWEPWLVLDQKLQESNVLPADPKEKLVDQQKQLVLALRMHDLSLINPNRRVLTAHELKFIQLDGLTESPLDAKHVAWLEPWRKAEHPVVRSVALLRIAQLGGTVSADELTSVLDNARALPLQAEALGAVAHVLDASKEPVSAEDRKALSKFGDDIKVVKGLARVRGDGKTTVLRFSANAWEIVAPPK